jgi:hypothetical protein
MHKHEKMQCGRGCMWDDRKGRRISVFSVRGRRRVTRRGHAGEVLYVSCWSMTMTMSVQGLPICVRESQLGQCDGRRDGMRAYGGFLYNHIPKTSHKFRYMSDC